MLEDRYGNALTTRSAAARDAYVEGVDRFLAGGSGIEQALASAIEADENFALAHVALARYRQVMGRRDEAQAALAAARANATGAADREKGHIAALGLLIEGKPQTAYEAVRAHLADHPRDAMVTQTSVSVFGLIGLSGQPGREAEQLAFTSRLAPHYGDDWWFLAQHAFAQLEAGQRGPAEVTAEHSFRGNPRNAYAAHVRSHIYYENGESDAGYGYVTEWMQDYARDALLRCHMSWHMALWALERGDLETMWQVVDAHIDPARSSGPPLNVLTDTAAILYRAGLAGVAVPPERWRVVSDYAARVFPKPGVAFADVHAALAHAMAGNGEALERIIADAAGPAADMVRLLGEAFRAMVAGEWAEAVRHLAGVMWDHARIGGSRAQRDLIEYAMLAALLKQGRAEEARLLLATRRRPLTSTENALKGL